MRLMVKPASSATEVTLLLMMSRSTGLMSILLPLDEDDTRLAHASDPVPADPGRRVLLLDQRRARETRILVGSLALVDPRLLPGAAVEHAAHRGRALPRHAPAQ